MRRGESSYIGRDANGAPSGFATMPTVGAGEEPAYYPARCEYCGERLDDKKHMTLHMRQRHPG